MTDDVEWVLLLPQVPSNPTRHRVAVWRELRRAGAVPVAAGAWTLPAVEGFQSAVGRAAELAETGGGLLAVFRVEPADGGAEALLREAYTAARIDEWAEFETECAKYLQEIAKEIAKQKFTFGELEEEEQSLDRLRRWYRDLKRRDVLALPHAQRAAGHLQASESALTAYSEQVYDAMHGRADSTPTPTASPITTAPDQEPHP